MRPSRRLAVVVIAVALIAVACSRTPPTPAGPPADGAAQVVTDADIGREIVIRGHLHGQETIMTDATFFYKAWGLVAGMQISLGVEEPAFLKPGAGVRVRGRIIMDGNRWGVESMMYTPPFWGLQVDEIVPSDHDPKWDTVFDVTPPKPTLLYLRVERWSPELLVLRGWPTLEDARAADPEKATLQLVRQSEGPDDLAFARTWTAGSGTESYPTSYVEVTVLLLMDLANRGFGAADLLRREGNVTLGLGPDDGSDTAASTDPLSPANMRRLRIVDRKSGSWRQVEPGIVLLALYGDPPSPAVGAAASNMSVAPNQ